MGFIKNNIKRFEESLNEIMEDGEYYENYFYLTNSQDYHAFVVFSSERLLVCEINPFTYEILDLNAEYLNNIEYITAKKGFFSTKVIFKPHNTDEIVLKPRNICIGLPMHKECINNLLEEYGE